MSDAILRKILSKKEWSILCGDTGFKSFEKKEFFYDSMGLFVFELSGGKNLILSITERREKDHILLSQFTPDEMSRDHEKDILAEGYFEKIRNQKNCVSYF